MARKGVSQTTYNSWHCMKQRCKNPNTVQYKYYGGRGIGYCPGWEHFDNFLADMGERPEGMTLDRIDNNKDYSPQNCKWSTSEDQVNNRRNTKMIEYAGKTMTLPQWAKFLGVKSSTMKQRYYVYKWPLDRLIGAYLG